MTTRLMPEIGSWYLDRSDGHLFQVVALDDHVKTVEVQDFDGSLDEIEWETWFGLPIDPAAAPEDPAGPADHVDPEEQEYALAGEGVEPLLPREPAALAEALFDGQEDDELLAELDEPLH